MQWTDKELRKLIAQIQELGARGADGRMAVTYGVLFVQTANVFEALSGTLLTAKKQGVVAYEGQLLLQGAHNGVVVTLLKEEIEDSTTETYMRKHPSGGAPPLARKGSGFGTETLKNAMLPCHICAKTVYPMEVRRGPALAFCLVAHEALLPPCSLWAPATSPSTRTAFAALRARSR